MFPIYVEVTVRAVDDQVVFPRVTVRLNMSVVESMAAIKLAEGVSFTRLATRSKMFDVDETVAQIEQAMAAFMMRVITGNL